MTTTYIGILEKEPGTLWGVWFPDLPGCIAAAATSEAVLDQVGEVLEQWIDCTLADGATVPTARKIEDLRLVPDVAEALQKGDTPIVVTLPEHALGFADDAIRAIRVAAAKDGITRLDFVRRAVLEKIAS